MPPVATVAASALRSLRRFLEVTNEIERAIPETEIYPVRAVWHWSNGFHEYMIVEESLRVDGLPMSDRTTAYFTLDRQQTPKNTCF